MKGMRTEFSSEIIQEDAGRKKEYSTILYPAKISFKNKIELVFFFIFKKRDFSRIKL